MASNKIIYGIDLGTTNSAIAKFDNGKAVVKKSPVQGDVTPSCVWISPKARFTIGQKAYIQLSKDLCLAFTKPGYKSNTYIEFKRIMGTTEKLRSTDLEKNGLDPLISPEQLSAEVLKTLRSYINDEDVKEAVITVPAMFNNNQKDATKAAAKLAGFDHFELIQEPVAASVAYGLGSKMKNAYWLVFDLGGGTFDAALMKIEEGIMKAVDTAGDNHLGGKDIDAAIVERIIIPYLQDNYSIDNCLENSAFKPMWKPKAEEAKINLSFNNSYAIQTDLGDEYGCDDDGKDFELDITIEQSDLEPVERPIFQKAIDITNQLLKKNHLTGEQLGALILVGGPTYSPVLRDMLRQQVTPNVDTSIDPMTAVACGAALYGSTIDVPEQIVDSRRDRSKIQLDVAVKSTSVEDKEYAAVKFLKDKGGNYTEGVIYVDFVRNDGEFSTGKVAITTGGDAIELQLKRDCTNVFTIRCYDSLGNKLDCEPDSVSIIQGIDGIGDAVLPLDYGIGAIDENDDVVFSPLEGLKKNMPLPGYGKNACKLYTDKNIRPGMSSDKIVIPILQTPQNFEQLAKEHKKLKMAYCSHINDIKITGDDIPAFLPARSEINITVHAEKSGTIDSFVIDIPHLDLTKEVAIKMQDVRLSEEEYNVFPSEIAGAKDKLKELNDDNLAKELSVAAEEFDNATDRDSKDKAIERLKEILMKIDTEYSLGDWQRMENKLLRMYNELVEDNNKYGNEKTTTAVKNLQKDVDRVIEAKDFKAAQELYDNLWNLDYKIAEIDYFIAWIRQWNRCFGERNWSDSSRARTLVNQGMQMINSGNPSADDLRPIVDELYDLLPYTQRPQNDGLLRQMR
ncbi:MAG: Hsp70 family protein [Prevotellaceae bacterium]|nr:Hsp70 family protein [Prevotellaceae bacterium]